MPRKDKEVSGEMIPAVERSPNDVQIDFRLIDYIAESKNLDKIDPNDRIMAHAISLRAAGWLNSEIANGLGINKAQLLIWEKTNKLFAACMSFIKELEAQEAEQMVWQNAINNKSASLERFFAIKGRLPEYRDNAPLPSTTITQLRITVNGQDFDVQATSPNLLESGEADLDV